MVKIIDEEVKAITQYILEDYGNGRAIDKMDDLFDQLDKEMIIQIIQKLLKIIFPGYYRDKTYKIYDVNNHLSLLVEDAMYNLNKQITFVLKYERHMADKAEAQIEKSAREKTVAFFKMIPKIREYLETDLQAAFDGDPAAYSKDEVIFAYPGMLAITVYRLAHELYLLQVPLIPRIMTEYAHDRTGIDIHPGASIGKYFFIDHGTGIVIGETTVIGDNVKIYQGVTLGALSTRGGQKLRSVKRHPTIGDNVTIYSGTSILGGDTQIGKDAVIGSNAFITKSIPEGTKVTIKGQELIYKYGSKETMQAMELE
ncbi:MAG: serine O-acetyltransferase EpsC [Ruminococcus sp.]|jgi:serine O-acetyltransferase